MSPIRIAERITISQKLEKIPVFAEFCVTWGDFF